MKNYLKQKRQRVKESYTSNKNKKTKYINNYPSKNNIELQNSSNDEISQEHMIEQNNFLVSIYFNLIIVRKLTRKIYIMWMKT